MIRVDDGDEYETTFSYCAFGVPDAADILAHGIGFATMAKLVTNDPFWDDVVIMCRARLADMPPVAPVVAD